MLCIPRSTSPIDNLPSGVLPSPKSRLFRRKESPATSPKPSPRASSNLSSSSASDASTSTAVTEGSSADSDAVLAAASTTLSKRAGAKWLGFARGGTLRAKKDDPIVSELAVASSPTAVAEEPYSGTTGQKSGSSVHERERAIKESSPDAPPTATGKTFLGLSWRPKDDSPPTPKATTTTAAATSSGSMRSKESLPVRKPIIHDLASDSDDDSDDTAHTAESEDESDLPFQRPQPFSPPPTSFYPPSFNRGSPSRPHPPESPRKQPLRSHTVLLQLTTGSLQSSSSPHPLITPRSSGTQQLFPRSCNLSRPLPRPRSVFVTLHKTRIIRRLESPSNLTAAEELSIMDFATRHPGSRTGDRGTAVSSSTSSIYPSYRQSSRSSLMRNLAMEDGELMREVDISAQTQGQDYPTFSKGLKRWLQRPSFEQRATMWLPATQGSDIGVIRSAVHRPALKGPAPLVFSEGLEALAGVTKNRKKGLTWRGRVAQTVSQVMAPLHHPKPVAIASSHLSRPSDGLPGLLIPPPPLLSSSPASSASGDTAPATPHSNSSSAQNLTSFVQPAFLKRLRQNGGQFDPAVSDEDDVPLGVVVISKRSAEDTEKARVRQEKEEKARKELEKERKKAKEAERRKMFKEQIMATRVRRENYRAGGRNGSISDDWIDVDGPSPKPTPKPSPSPKASPAPSRRTSTVPSVTSQGGIPPSSSAQSIRSQSSARSRPNSIRPPSIAASDRSRRSSQQLFNPVMLNPQMIMGNPQMAFGPQMPMGMMTPNGQFVYNGMPSPVFFAPPPPISSRSSIRSRTGSDTGSGGEFGTKPSPQQFRSLPSRARASSNLAPPPSQTEAKRSSQYLGVQQSPRRGEASSLRSASASSLRSPSPNTLTPRRSSFVPPMTKPIA